MLLQSRGNFYSIYFNGLASLCADTLAAGVRTRHGVLPGDDFDEGIEDLPKLRTSRAEGAVETPDDTIIKIVAARHYDKLSMPMLGVTVH